MERLPRTFVVIYSEFVGGDPSKCSLYREAWEQKRISFAELVTLIDWMAQEYSDSKASRNDSEYKALSEKYEACAQRCKCEFEDCHDPEWKQVDDETCAWFDAKQVQAIMEAGFEAIADLRTNHKDAYWALAMVGASSLANDKSVIPVSTLMEAA